jgi:hypothetical protein
MCAVKFSLEILQHGSEAKEPSDAQPGHRCSYSRYRTTVRPLDRQPDGVPTGRMLCFDEAPAVVRPDLTDHV